MAGLSGFVIQQSGGLQGGRESRNTLVGMLPGLQAVDAGIPVFAAKGDRGIVVLDSFAGPAGPGVDVEPLLIERGEAPDRLIPVFKIDGVRRRESRSAAFVVAVKRLAGCIRRAVTPEPRP